MKADIDSRIHH